MSHTMLKDISTGFKPGDIVNALTAEQCRKFGKSAYSKFVESDYYRNNFGSMYKDKPTKRAADGFDEVTR